MLCEKTVEDIMNDLIQLDIDAYFAYEEAIEHIDEKDIREQLKIFQADHKKHIENLSVLLKQAGGKPIEYSQDIKGKILQGLTWLTSIIGTKGALEAMIKNEKITNNKYQKALEYEEFTDEIRNQIQKNFEDEKRHLAYVEAKKKELY